MDERAATGLMQSPVIRTKGHDFKLTMTYGNIPFLKEYLINGIVCVDKSPSVESFKRNWKVWM